MQILLRIVSLCLIVVALALLGADAITSFDKGGEITVRSVDQVWALLLPGGEAAFRIWAEHHWPPAALHAFDTIRTLPGWGVTGVPGVLLNFLSGRQRPGAA
ncbi:MAG TPA: hypothetical protein VG819_14830 [Rhizomicrobium sp.]|jgi:hypothetical protein|nr:hypothetical protein [Rhizomicrobium sp.]